MKLGWSQVALGETLEKSEEWIVVNPDQEYSQITIRLWGKGVLQRGIVKGSQNVSLGN